MGLDAISRRRWTGSLALGVALGLLVAGQTVLRERLTGVGFLMYWLACFVFTGLAVLLALLYVRSLRGRSRREQRDLVENTLAEIERDARAHERKNRRS